MHLFHHQQAITINQLLTNSYSLIVSKARQFTKLSPIHDDDLLKYINKYRIDQVRNQFISRKRKRSTINDDDRIIFDIASNYLLKKYICTKSSSFSHVITIRAKHYTIKDDLS